MNVFVPRAASGIVLVLIAFGCGGSSFTSGDDTENTGGSAASGRGGSGTGGSGVSTGGSSGGTGASGGSVGSGGSGVTAGGRGGASAGVGGEGASSAGASGSGASSAGGGASAAGTDGCGPCPGFACGPVLVVAVTAPNSGAIADLEAEATFPVECLPNGTSPCQWVCQASVYQLPAGDYTVTLSAPDFEPTKLEFSVAAQTNCGCCGCGCTQGFYGEVMLEGEGGAACCTDRRLDPLHCGECGNDCGTSSCVEGTCQGGTECAELDEEECSASSECHAVYSDLGTCDCAVPGCCTGFSFCADGDRADCEGASLSCLAATPYCEGPAYVVSYDGNCYEGCVVPEDCAP